MSDSQNTPQNGQQNPLDVLEQLLKDAQGKGAAGASGAAANDTQKQEKEAAEAAMKVELDQAEELSRQQAAAQLQSIQTQLQQTPQYQARVAQQEEEKSTQAQVSEAMHGHEIRQLGHTKV